MSPSMPITIASSASATSSAASSSNSSSGVYIPVHRRTPSDISTRAEPKRILPIYTPAELMQLAQSPLSQRLSTRIHDALHGQEFSSIALSKKQQRSREYMQRQNQAADVKKVVVVTPRRRPVGRTAERSNSRRNATSKFMEAASWRGQTTRHMEALPVPVAV
ncbi:hypothetical protein C8R43DRAFT_985340 [Mycena crocata]|nr:hypothetical protein C8R43DRAFT_985340 [Mycena crocata]